MLAGLMRTCGTIAIVLAVASMNGCEASSPGATGETSATFTPVRPLARANGADASVRPARELRIGQGQFFQFAMPPDWRVGEDGQFALSLIAPDNKALTLMVGNAGLPPGYPPGRFAQEKLMALQPQDLHLSRPRPAVPVAGFAEAYDFDVSYSVQGIASRGVVKVSIAPAYDTATMAMTGALSAADQWPGYSPWLPQVADQITATNGGAFGMRGIMQQNLQNSTALAQAAQRYRDWSQKSWQQVTDERNASLDRQNVAVREHLGGVQTYANPFGDGPAVELPTTHKYYWTDRQGAVVGTDDPSADPNVGSTSEWRKMEHMTR